MPIQRVWTTDSRNNCRSLCSNLFLRISYNNKDNCQILAKCESFLNYMAPKSKFTFKENTYTNLDSSRHSKTIQCEDKTQ